MQTQTSMPVMADKSRVPSWWTMNRRSRACCAPLTSHGSGADRAGGEPRSRASEWSELVITDLNMPHERRRTVPPDLVHLRRPDFDLSVKG
jgi:hypothetical protein